MSFLDLFSGTGILGVEAASRGAAPVLLVEKDHAEESRHPEEHQLRGDRRSTWWSHRWSGFFRTNQRSWDIIFLDPPFDLEGKGLVLDAACAPPHLAPGGLAIMHLPSAEKLSTDREGLELVDRRTYGQSLLLFFRRREACSA